MKNAITSILSALAGAMVGVWTAGRTAEKAIGRVQTMSDKHLALFLMMNQWVKIKQEGKKVSDCLEERGYKTIAIYGMSYAGERLLDELKSGGVTVKYGIDKKADGIYSEIDVISPDSALEQVDAVIVTSIFFIDDIEKALSEKLSCPVISLEDILYEI